MKTYIIYTYFSVNLFLAGITFKDYEGDDKRYWSTLIMALFGIIVYLILLLLALKEILRPPFFIRFYWAFYITKYYDNLSKKDLYDMNERQIRRYPNDKSMKKYLQMVNKKNNYVYSDNVPQNGI